MKILKSRPPRTVDIIVYPGFKALEAIAPMSVFEYANTHLQRRGKGIGYDIRVASTTAGFVQSDTLVALHATKAINTLALPDDAIVVGARDIQSALSKAQALVRWIAEVSGKIGRLAALCSGAFFLASAGILDGKRATTHWSVARLFQEQFPSVFVDMDPIFIRTGNIWTSAGVTAGIDLALAFVEEDFGRELALEVAGDLVVYMQRPGSQSQLSTYLKSQKTVQAGIRDVQAWILANLDRRLPVALLADKAKMSSRNFMRVFRQEAGLGTREFIEMARFERARQLLADPGMPIKIVASRSGFANLDQMRRVFRKRLGITPKIYRQRFCLAEAHDRLEEAAGEHVAPFAGSFGVLRAVAGEY